MGSEGITSTLRETLDVFETENVGAPLTTTEIADQLDVGRRTTYERLERLTERGMVETKKVGASGRVWWRPPSVSHRADASLTNLLEAVSGILYRRRAASGHLTSFVAGDSTALTGYDDSLLASDWPGWLDDVVHPDDRDRVRSILDASTDERSDYSLVYRIRTADGETRLVRDRGRVLRDEDGSVVGSEGLVVRVDDEPDRAERERELGAQVRQQEVVTELGRLALESHDVDRLMSRAVNQICERLDADYCKVLDLDDDGERLVLRHGAGWEDGLAVSAAVPAVDDDSQAAYTLRNEGPVVVEDLDADSRFGGPDLLTSHGVTSGVSTVVGPSDDPWGILGVHYTERRSFSSPEVNFVQSVANVLAAAVEHNEYERELARQHEQLIALDNLNGVVRRLNEAVVEQSTREEIERVVVDTLAESDSYAFAWIVEVDSATDLVQLRCEAGVEGYLDDVSISADPDDPRSDGPTGQALLTHETQICRDADSDPDYEQWRDRAHDLGFQSSAAIPVVHEGTRYGVLNVYADRPNAFAAAEREVIGHLGEVIGLAIAAVERQRALMGDEVVELEFRVQDRFDAFESAATADTVITIDRTVPLGDGAYLQYGTVSGGGSAALDRLAELEAAEHWQSVTVLDGEDDEETHFEVRLSEPPAISLIAAHGGYVDEARIVDGDYRLTAHLSPSADVRQVIEALTEVYPDLEMVARRQTRRTETSVDRVDQRLDEVLTERQRTALEVAYNSGYFEWPRNRSGEEVADSLGVSSPTFHQHIRKALSRLVRTLYDDRRGRSEN